jgi:hypothetical protein
VESGENAGEEIFVSMSMSAVTIICALIGSFTMILLAVLGFLFKREREMGVVQGKLSAAHKRLDRIEKLVNHEED